VEALVAPFCEATATIGRATESSQNAPPEMTLSTVLVLIVSYGIK
jgi:hypothetical protein